jgi:hypothetical protein
MTEGRLTGQAALEVIDAQIAAHGKSLLDHLRPFDRDGAVGTWHDFIRSSEEMINILAFGLSDAERAWFLALP